ncbi:hypothetical protein ACLK1S_00395 [Escherichia coli]
MSRWNLRTVAYFSHLLVKPSVRAPSIARNRVMFNPGDTITSHDGWQMQNRRIKKMAC